MIRFFFLLFIYLISICKHMSLIKSIVLLLQHCPAVTVERKQRRKKILFILFFFRHCFFVRLLTQCDYLTQKKSFFFLFFLFKIFISGQCWIDYKQYDPTTRPFIINIIYLIFLIISFVQTQNKTNKYSEI